MMGQSVIQNKAHYHELDLLRFIAALAVVFYHYTFVHTVSFSEIASYPVLGDIFKYGYMGVELFFMISGFVILMTTVNKSPVEFVISRISRLYPAFWVALLITTLSIVFFVVDDSKEISLSRFLINLSMVPEYINIDSIDPVYWTLQVEIKFYFWMFVIVLMNKLANIESFLSVWILISILDAFQFTHGLSRLLFIPEWAPYFCAGALFFIVKTQGLSTKRVLLLFLAYLLSIHYAIVEGQLKASHFESDFSPIVVTILITALYLLFIWFINRNKDYQKSRNMLFLGALTYPLYLIHNVLGEIIFTHLAQDINQYTLLISVIVLMLIISFVISYFIEPKISKLMKSALLKYTKVGIRFGETLIKRS